MIITTKMFCVDNTYLTSRLNIYSRYRVIQLGVYITVKAGNWTLCTMTVFRRQSWNKLTLSGHCYSIYLDLGTVG